MTERACEQTQRQLLDYVRGALAPEEARALEAHVAGCAECASALAEEQTVNELLRTRLPVTKAPDSLQRAVAAQLARTLAAAQQGSVGPQPTAAGSQLSAAQPSAADASARAAEPSAAEPEGGLARAHALPRPANQRGATVTRRGWLVASLGTASLAAAGVLGLVARGSGPESSLPREALNDHLRVLYAQNPVEIPNGGLHQVKPWFTGRVDFAPDISFVGDDEFPMVGGAVGYFVNRKAASFVFKRRLHTISLFVFRNDGLDWPSTGTAPEVAGQRVQVSTLDGFHLVYWAAEGLGHVLVSDVSSGELLSLTDKLLK